MVAYETVLLLGNGGREHAWALALHKSGAKIINWAPSVNPGIEKLSEKVIESNYEEIPELANYEIDLAIIGPEKPLVMGLVDDLKTKGIPAFGPSKANARLEGSKIYMRNLMDKFDIEGNIDYTVCNNEDELMDALGRNYVVAVKPEGLTGGKGVRVYGDHFKDKGEVEQYALKIIERDGRVLLEELLDGIEFTIQAFVNGSAVEFLPLVKDYKRAFDGDIGPNTGSMGSCSFADHSLPYLSKEELKNAKAILKHIISAASLQNGPYVGPIYGQFMLTDDGPKIVEINARLGDPEAINVLELLNEPLLDVIDGLMNKNAVTRSFENLATVCVYLVPEGYPDNPEGGTKIKYDPKNEEKIRFASVEKENDQLITTTSRSIAVIGTGKDIIEARENTYEAVPKDIDGLRYRNDIGEEFT